MKASKQGIIFWGVLLLCGTVLSAPAQGKKAPDITIREWITENPPDLKDLAGRVYVIEFWATWCHSCVENIPHLIELNNKYADSGLRFIALSQDKSAELLRKFVRQKRINYDVAIDNGTVDWYGIKGYPTVVVVDHKGRIAWRGYPWNSGFEKAIDKAIAAGPPAILAGIDMGPFDRLKKSLWGGRDFAKAYRTIRSHLNDKDQNKNSAIAKQIIETIDRNIARKIKDADRIRSRDPKKAYGIYAAIVAKYSGIEIVKPARTAYLELKKHKHTTSGVIATVGVVETFD